MRRWSFVLRPSWLALAVVVVAFTYLCFTVLAPWQLGKNTRTSRENHQIEHSLTIPPVPIKELLPQQDSTATGAQWRRVTATGQYRRDVQVLARLRVVDGEPALEVLAPFVVDGGPTVLVDRGYIRPEQNGRLPPIPPPPPAAVTITARLRNAEAPAAGKDPIVEDGVRQVYSIDTDQVAGLTGVALAKPYLQLVEGQPGGLGVVGLPHLDAGPFLSYGIQWITFGIVAPILLGYFVFAEVRARRAETGRPGSTAQTAGLAKPMSVEEKLTDRYGRRR
jgi:cytochrome oxidase assembly protein ShyY1